MITVLAPTNFAASALSAKKPVALFCAKSLSSSVEYLVAFSIELNDIIFFLLFYLQRPFKNSAVSGLIPPFRSVSEPRLKFSAFFCLMAADAASLSSVSR